MPSKISCPTVTFVKMLWFDQVVVLNVFKSLGELKHCAAMGLLRFRFFADVLGKPCECTVQRSIMVVSKLNQENALAKIGSTRRGDHESVGVGVEVVSQGKKS
jgi:hypothetical protein